MDKYIVMTAAANMPSSCMGNYGRVAIVETNGIDVPKQIHSNHRAVVRIVRTWERRNIGKTARCAFQVALAEAQALCNQLNQGSAQ